MVFHTFVKSAEPTRGLKILRLKHGPTQPGVGPIRTPTQPWVGPIRTFDRSDSDLPTRSDHSDLGLRLGPDFLSDPFRPTRTRTQPATQGIQTSLIQTGSDSDSDPDRASHESDPLMGLIQTRVGSESPPPPPSI